MNGTFVKDLTRLGRNIKDVIILDNSPAAYMMQPENALPILSWYDCQKDKELAKLLPILEKFSTVDDVRNYIKYLVIENRILFTRAQTMMNAVIQRNLNKDKPFK